MESKRFGYCVEVETYRSESEESYGDDEYDYSWFCDCSNKILTLRPCDKVPDVVCPYQFSDGDLVFLVWAEYSSGDSFGMGCRNNVEILSLFKDSDAAQEVAKWYGSLDDESAKASHLCLDGQELSLRYVPWLSYFEHLDEIHVTALVLEEAYECES